MTIDHRPWFVHGLPSIIHRLLQQTLKQPLHLRVALRSDSTRATMPVKQTVDDRP
ncbi:MAG: hypothetical protein IPJ46_09165 [Anaerolineales bacterium]|nr:hypothetical protein [Anaerolineales bacterium]